MPHTCLTWAERAQQARLDRQHRVHLSSRLPILAALVTRHDMMNASAFTCHMLGAAAGSWLASLASSWLDAAQSHGRLRLQMCRGIAN